VLFVATAVPTATRDAQYNRAVDLAAAIALAATLASAEFGLDEGTSGRGVQMESKSSGCNYLKQLETCRHADLLGEGGDGFTPEAMEAEAGIVQAQLFRRWSQEVL
jgi:hypothetical protein